MKKMVGKMKDENARLIEQFVALCPKMYSILETEGFEYRKAKGAKKAVVQRELRHEQYKECVFGKKLRYDGMNIIRSKWHKMFSVRLNKILLSPMDTKRWIAEDGVMTLASGHNTAVARKNCEDLDVDAFVNQLLISSSSTATF